MILKSSERVARYERRLVHLTQSSGLAQLMIIIWEEKPTTTHQASCYTRDKSVSSGEVRPNHWDIVWKCLHRLDWVSYCEVSQSDQMVSHTSAWDDDDDGKISDVHSFYTYTINSVKMPRHRKWIEFQHFVLVLLIIILQVPLTGADRVTNDSLYFLTSGVLPGTR